MRTLLILCLAYILFIHGLGSISLWDPDEPRQALMAREMVDRGDYIHPYLNGLPYLEKPPLHPWLIMLTARITGKVDEFSSRLPSAIAAALLLLFTYFLGRRLDHEVSGFLGALILATNYQFLGNARESVMDMTFALFIGMAIFLGYLSIEKERKWLLALSLLPCACAILTKGTRRPGHYRSRCFFFIAWPPGGSGARSFPCWPAVSCRLPLPRSGFSWREGPIPRSLSCTRTSSAT